MTEIDYNAVFGFEGEEAQEAADPATEDNVGANEQEAAAPAGESQDGAEPEQKPSEESGHHVQTDEENARYAAMRRRAEADAEKRMNAELDKSIASLGLTDPYTNKPITNHSEMQAYRQRFLEEQRKEMQEKAGMSPEDYQRFVDSLPEVQEGKKAQQKVMDLEIRAKIDSQMREIQMISPEIKSMEDLSKLDNFDKLYDMGQEDPAELDLLKFTPSSALGSCRYKLADPDKDDTDYQRILEIFKKYNVRYFFYNGGNDSMDTCNKISKYMQGRAQDHRQRPERHRPLPRLRLCRQVYRHLLRRGLAGRPRV